MLALEGVGPDYAWNRPSLTPSLATWVTPFSWGSPSIQIRETGRRHGLEGLSESGRREIERTIGLFDEYVREAALWTVTLPDEDYEELRISGRWSAFQRAVPDLLARFLRAAGVPALVLAVVEVGTERTTRTGRPMPHIHLVCAGWGERASDGQWLLRPEAMDQLLAGACRAAGLPARPRVAASRIEKVRRGVKAYLSSYLKKGSDLSACDLSGGWDALVPHQWWNRSKEAKALRDGHTWRLPVAFAAFVEQQRARLERLGLGVGLLKAIGRRQTKTVDRAIEVLCFQWLSVEALQAGLEWFAVWAHSPPAFEAAADRCEL